MCNFHVGQKVVYIGDDLDFDPNPGKTIHTIQAIRKGCCVKCPVEIDLGKRRDGVSRCGYCNSGERTHVYWKNANNFRPLINDYTEAEIEAVNIDEVIEPLCEPVNQ